MKLPVIKQLVESATLVELKAAEEALHNEEQPTITVEGSDEGEQLTHVLGAIWVKQAVAEGMDVNLAVREYAKKVRNSIG
jgi:hypothetical protein